ncbi:MAG TPA: hypothetical protein VNT81_03570 [Vicinamibacterales bacterium]|nr:hypothetical protein [Vicinamibacterales bacterium]
MGRFIVAVTAALALSAAALSGQAHTPPQPGTERITPQGQAAAKNLMQDVKTIGCIRLWKPAPDDPTKMPPDRQPGLAGIYLLTPVAASPTTVTDLPTYLLTPSATLNFSQHVGHKVEITGTAQPAPMPTSVQELVTAPTMRPEEKPSTNGMPRLTVLTMKMVTEGCS